MVFSRHFGLSHSASYADITDANLDDMISDLVGENDKAPSPSVHSYEHRLSASSIHTR